MIKRFYNFIRFKNHMRKHGYPHRSHVFQLVKDHPEYRTSALRIQQIAFEYAIYGRSLEEISKYHKVTRERVRQCLNKFYRQALREDL
jgi:hypothetical protein